MQRVSLKVTVRSAQYNKLSSLALTEKSLEMRSMFKLSDNSTTILIKNKLKDFGCFYV